MKVGFVNEEDVFDESGILAETKKRFRIFKTLVRIIRLKLLSKFNLQGLNFKSFFRMWHNVDWEMVNKEGRFQM